MIDFEILNLIDVFYRLFSEIIIFIIYIGNLN